MLKAIGENVSRGLRPDDVVGRWGSEEFLVLAPDVGALRPGDLAEPCRILIAESSVAAGFKRVSVTASIGATVLIHSDNANSVISRADELMYRSKHSGGDRTTAGRSDDGLTCCASSNTRRLPDTVHWPARWPLRLIDSAPQEFATHPQSSNSPCLRE